MENLRFETQERMGDTIGEVAYRRIRAHIVNGQLLPDSKLKLDRMKEIYGASVTTLREILNRLAVEELVTAEGQRGFRVAAVSGQRGRVSRACCPAHIAGNTRIAGVHRSRGY